jgi:hypothetical protein
MSNDPEDKKAAPEMGRTFTFRGKELAPFSWNARTTLYRLMSERTPLIEEYTYIVYLLLAKTPKQMDALRGEDALATFRIEAGEWAEKERLGGGKGWEELKTLADSIVDAVQRAESFEPVPSKKTKPGK